MFTPSCLKKTLCNLWQWVLTFLICLIVSLYATSLTSRSGHLYMWIVNVLSDLTTAPSLSLDRTTRQFSQTLILTKLAKKKQVKANS